MVPVVTCAHTCGHRCGGGCGACGGVTTCVQYRPVTTYACQQVPVMRPTVKCVPETTYVQRTRTKMMPVKQTVQVPQVKVNRIPYQVTQCVTVTEFQSYDVPITRIVKKPIYGTVPGLRDQDGSGIDDRRRADGQMPAGDRNRLAAGRGLCPLPGAGHRHDHSDADRRSPGARHAGSAGTRRVRPGRGVSSVK